jgi:hypothetical protein
LHDAVAAERLGVPAAGIMTSQFVSAAELMARVLGAEGFAFIVIEHPISSAGSEGLELRARSAIEDCARLLTGTQ